MAMADADFHFAAFSFVDRVDAFEQRRLVRGRYRVPADVRFPACLAAEAVGQLAAWVSMDAVDYRGRPVAALAGDTRFHGDVPPGSVLELAADVESCDEEAFAYTGHASVAGRKVIELFDCFAPLLPVPDFDDPEALRARFAVLRGAGAAAGRFRGVAPFLLAPLPGEPGRVRRAALDVPASAPFFADHFPRRPVFPATLLLDTLIGVALELAAERAGPARPVTRMTRVKVRSFTPPGARLELAAELVGETQAGVSIALAATAEGKNVATARVELAAPGAED
jgi:3-hydroxymyristoyl/3-hydroxydecanoyl-(acyl carrier protein) dehydratase